MNPLPPNFSIPPTTTHNPDALAKAYRAVRFPPGNVRLRKDTELCCSLALQGDYQSAAKLMRAIDEREVPGLRGYTFRDLIYKLGSEGAGRRSEGE